MEQEGRIGENVEENSGEVQEAANDDKIDDITDAQVGDNQKVEVTPPNMETAAEQSDQLGEMENEDPASKEIGDEVAENPAEKAEDNGNIVKTTEEPESSDVPKTVEENHEQTPNPPENTMDIMEPSIDDPKGSEVSQGSKRSKKSSPKSTIKLPPISSSTLPMRYPSIGVGDLTYHPVPTPRRQMRPFGLRPTNLSHFNHSASTDSHHFQPDVNSLSGYRYEDSLADSGFASGSLHQNPPPVLQADSDMDYDEMQIIDMPFQPQKFKSSTVMKMVTVPRRHQDMFGNNKERFYSKNRGMAFHTDRYNYLETVTDKFDRSPSQLSQRQRMLLEASHLEKLRDIRKELGCSAPHRVPLNLAMGGSKVEFFDRVDIPAELRELKNVSLPDYARDLYVGRGIALPEGHSLNKPRRLLPIARDRS